MKAIGAIASVMFDGMDDMKEHPYAKRIQSEIRRLQAGAEALANVRANRSPIDTPEAHALKVARLARKFSGEAQDALRRASSLFLESQNDVKRRIDEKIDLRPSAFADEIRAVVRSMKPSEKAKYIERLVSENNGPEIAAIVKAPSILTGLDDAERAQYERMLLERHAGSEVSEGENLEAVYDASHDAVRAAMTMIKRFSDPSSIAEIEQAAATATAASAAFDQSMGAPE